MGSTKSLPSETVSEALCAGSRSCVAVREVGRSPRGLLPLRRAIHLVCAFLHAVCTSLPLWVGWVGLGWRVGGRQLV